MKNLYWIIIKLSRTNPVSRITIDYLALFYYKIFRSNLTFKFRGQSYKYFYHIYNRTVASERIVEIPIAKELLDEYKGKRVLEIGNVMSHYFPITHDVLDKYEIGEGVINEDIVNYKTNKRYDLIFSVSTLEHIGYSYGEKKDTTKFKKSVRNIKRMLAKNGLLFATFPIYLNPEIDELFEKDKMPFNESYYMKRVSAFNEWVQIDREIALKGSRYDEKYANANILYLGYHHK